MWVVRIFRNFKVASSTVLCSWAIKIIDVVLIDGFQIGLVSKVEIITIFGNFFSFEWRIRHSYGYLFMFSLSCLEFNS